MAALLRGRGALLVALAVLAIFAYVAYETQTWSTRSRLFATTIAVPAIALALAQVVREARSLRIPQIVPPEARLTRSAVVWAAAFFVSLAMLGLLATVPLFAVAYLKAAANERWLHAAAYGLVAWLFVELVFVRLLHVPLPAGAIPLPAISP
ncbi:MAG: tripartite tricarboxylate transporter TctB family protein [Candidatus Limnocylindria bacterium]